MRNTLIKKRLIFFAKLSIAIVAFWYLFHSGFLTKESIIILFKLNTLPIILFTGLSFIISMIFSAMRLMILLRTIDFHLQFVQSFQLTMVGFFFNLALPGVVGGDVVKGYYLIKHENHSKGRSSGIVVIDRMLGVFALMIIGGISILYLLQQHSADLRPYNDTLYLVCIIIGFFMSLFAAFLVFGRNRRVRKELKRLFTAIFRKSIFYHILDSFGILAKHRRILLFSFLLSLLIHSVSLAGLLILGKMIHTSLPDPITLVAIFSLVLLFGIIPITPGNIGWTELLASQGLLAVGSGAGAEIFLYWRIITVLCSFPGGFLYLLATKDEKQMLKTQDVAVDTKTSVM